MEAERNGLGDKEVEIKVPQSLLDMYPENPSLRDEYEAFIRS
jgi:hypothetical protein